MLLEAIKQGRIVTVKYLLQSSNVNIDSTDKHGQTALIKACLLEDKMAITRAKLTRLLLNKGANVNNIDVHGRNVLIWACFLGKTDIVEILLTSSLMDMDLGMADRKGNTALHYAVTNGNSQLVTMLVEPMVRFGICLDKRNNEGRTALLGAVKYGKECCARVLLDNGASGNVVDPDTLMTVYDVISRDNTQDDERDLPDMTSSEVIETKRGLRVSKSAGWCETRCHDPKKLNRRSSYVPPPRRECRSASLLKRVNENQVLLGETKTGQKLLEKTDKRRHILELSHIEGQPRCRKNERKISFDETRPRVPRTFREATKEHFSESLRDKIHVFAKRNEKTSFPEVTAHDSDTKTKSGYPSSFGSYARRPSTSVSQNGAPQPPSKELKNPYDLRDFKSVLSLYGEQNLSTYRTGFSTKAMTPEQFQLYLEAVAMQEQPIVPPLEEPAQEAVLMDQSLSPRARCSSVSCESQLGLRRSVLRKSSRSRAMTDPNGRYRQTSQTSIVPPLKRNITAPAMKARLPSVGRIIPRRQSMMGPSP